MSMPRGAAVVYPKDSAQIVHDGRHLPGRPGRRGRRRLRGAQHVAAAGHRRRRPAGSFERREDFADIARGNARAFFGRDHPAWRVVVGDLVEALPTRVEPGTVDRVVLDMLAPWECLDAVADAMLPGGVLICYVATTTQLSRVAEAHARATAATPSRTPGSPSSAAGTWRAWRCGPQHRMHGHTGFLVTTRRLAPGVTPPVRTRRPAKGSTSPRPTSSRRASGTPRSSASVQYLRSASDAYAGL